MRNEVEMNPDSELGAWLGVCFGLDDEPKDTDGMHLEIESD